MLKGGIFLALMAIGAWWAGLFGGKGYSRIVDRPQAQVVAALEDLDITAQPGSPAFDPSGHSVLDMRLEEAVDHMTWRIMAGDKVATAMTATFAPIDGGKRTKVTTSVRRGDAPDDMVSPAFRSTGITSAFFSLAVEGELDKLTAPPRASAETCRDLMGKMSTINEADPALREKAGNITQAFGQGAKTLIRLNQMNDALRRAGCPTVAEGAFGSVPSETGPASERMSSVSRTADRSFDGIPGN